MGSSVAVLVGPHLSFLDHLIPLCDLFDIPLYAPNLVEQLLYPPVKIVESLDGFDTLFYVEPSRLHQEAFQFGNLLLPEKRRSICGLHGNSNKCRDAYWAERFAEEEIVLLYGDYMQQFFQEKGVWERIKKPLFCGNYRWHYYQKYKEQLKVTLSGEGKKILYAPTWSYADATDDSPFFHCYSRLLDHVPDGFTVIVKLHPYMYLLHPQKVEELEKRYQDNPRVFFLEKTPHVYPILEEVDLYIGDYSSVAYDFLAFDRPLFFWAESIDPKLQKCGHKIGEGELFSQLEKEGSSEDRRQLYNHCFADVSEVKLRATVEEALDAH